MQLKGDQQRSREAHDAWFRAKVREALEDTAPDVSHEEVESESAERRANTLLKIAATKA